MRVHRRPATRHGPKNSNLWMKVQLWITRLARVEVTAAYVVLLVSAIGPVVRSSTT